MKIKKVDDKPMVIHTKTDVKIHMHQNKEVGIKGQNVYTVNHSPKIKSAQVTDSDEKKSGKEQYRKSTIHQGKKKHNSVVDNYRRNLRESNKSIKVKNSSIKIVGATGARAATNQLEGGEEVQQASMIAYELGRPVTGTASKGAEIFRHKAMDDMKRRIKKVESGRKLARKQIKKTSVNVAKKTAKDSGKVLAKKAAKTATKKTAKGIASVVAGTASTGLAGPLVGIAASMAIVCLPVILVVAVIYNSPFAIFLPPLSDGDTVMTITSQYVAELNHETSILANNHTGYDEGQIVYVDYEGSYAVPSNYYDIMCVYMVKYGVGDTATVMNDLSKQRLKEVFNDMSSYSTTIGTETVENEDGTTSTRTILYVNITLKTFRQMETEYDFSADEIEMLEAMMSPENLALIGYTGGTGGGSGGGGNAVSTLSQTEINAIISSITDAEAKQTCSFALSKVGYPYSQDYRDSGSYYDCSSLVYYSWKAAGVDISNGGATTAAAEGQGLDEAGKIVSFDEIQPGDLIFYSYTNNGRYKNISHVAIYVGNGKVVEALNESVGVIYRDVSTGSIVMVARP